MHVNGSRDRAFNVTIDGIEANESTVPNPVSNLYRLTPDNISEYKVTTSNATPEEGRNSGANVNIATRQGSNAFHGTAFEFFRNTDLNSNEFFANAQGTPKPDIKMNQYGAELGRTDSQAIRRSSSLVGPIRRSTPRSRSTRPSAPVTSTRPRPSPASTGTL